MATNPKITLLLTSLRSATAEGRIRWSETFQTGIFELIVKDAKIQFAYQSTARGDQFYINIGNSQGATVESELLYEGDEGFNLASDLYPLVRRNALKVDEFLDSVIAAVESGNGAKN